LPYRLSDHLGLDTRRDAESVGRIRDNAQCRIASLAGAECLGIIVSRRSAAPTPSERTVHPGLWSTSQSLDIPTIETFNALDVSLPQIELVPTGGASLTYGESNHGRFQPLADELRSSRWPR
jgi:hypothetical protein